MDRKGFTLIEVLVAMVVLSIALLAVVQMNIMYVKANIYNHQLSAATMLVQEKMEELRGYARSDRTDKFSPIDFDFLVSTDTGVFTSVWVEDIDLNGTVEANETVYIPGLGSGRAPLTLFSGKTYNFMTLTGGVFTGSKTVNAMGSASAFDLVLTWVVTPLTVFDTVRPDYAHLIVATTWTDQYGSDRTVRIESMINRRQ
jgi:prepilin-type N-terminal cleavage/methylation domain-containing protein